MRCADFAVFALGLLVASGPMPGIAGEPGKGKMTGNKLVGTWKLVARKYGAKEVKIAPGTTMLKQVTPTQFMWVSYDTDGKVFRTAGGRYTLKGDQYAETPEYGAGPDFQIIRAKTQTYKAKVEGNRWHSDGALSNGLTIREVWERLEQKG
jgi:hypothetical protein